MGIVNTKSSISVALLCLSAAKVRIYFGIACVSRVKNKSGRNYSRVVARAAGRGNDNSLIIGRLGRLGARKRLLKYFNCKEITALPARCI